MTYAPLLRAARRAWRAASLPALLALMSGCASETLFQSQFNANGIGAPPAATQAVGTLVLGGAPGSIIVVNPPPGATEQWVRISRNGDQAPITSMQGNFSKAAGDGTYTMLAALFIPGGSGLATVEFDTSPSGSPANAQFLHMDFMQDGTVRMDDDAGVTWGSYPHDQYFTLIVTLDVGATTTAHLSMLGNGATGTLDYHVPLGSLAHQIGAVKFWMGYPWQGSFDVTDILVTRKTN
jgi:hypothetical protein